MRATGSEQCGGARATGGSEQWGLRNGCPSDGGPSDGGLSDGGPSDKARGGERWGSERDLGVRARWGSERLLSDRARAMGVRAMGVRAMRARASEHDGDRRADGGCDGGDLTHHEGTQSLWLARGVG